jgi:hypothetical protein
LEVAKVKDSGSPMAMGSGWESEMVLHPTSVMVTGSG